MSWLTGLTQNRAELDPGDPDPLLRPARLSAPPADVAQRLRAWADQTPRWCPVSEETHSEGGIRIHLTRRTRLFRFTDDVHVDLIPERTSTSNAADAGPTTTVLMAVSQSRVGKGDLGQNRRNLKELVTGLKG